MNETKFLELVTAEGDLRTNGVRSLAKNVKDCKFMKNKRAQGNSFLVYFQKTINGRNGA